MLKLYYCDENVRVPVCEVMANHTMTADEMIELCGIDMDMFSRAHGWDDYDPNALIVVSDGDCYDTY